MKRVLQLLHGCNLDEPNEKPRLVYFVSASVHDSSTCEKLYLKFQTRVLYNIPASEQNKKDLKHTTVIKCSTMLFKYFSRTSAVLIRDMTMTHNNKIVGRLQRKFNISLKSHTKIFILNVC